MFFYEIFSSSMASCVRFLGVLGGCYSTILVWWYQNRYTSISGALFSNITSDYEFLPVLETTNCVDVIMYFFLNSGPHQISPFLC
jgi:hypothetical protein